MMPSTLQSNLDDFAKETLKTACILQLKNQQVSPPQFNAFLTQQALIAPLFETLLILGTNKAQAIDDPVLVNALQRRKNSAQGIDEHGELHLEKSQAFLRYYFLNVLNINQEKINCALALPGTIAYKQIIYQLKKMGNVLMIAGAIVALEHHFPLEYQCIQLARDHLFPTLFIPSDTDPTIKEKEKKLARQYVDQHAMTKKEDSDLLLALKKYEASEISIKQMSQGIALIRQATQRFYQSIDACWRQINNMAQSYG